MSQVNFPIQINFRNLEHSPAIEENARNYAEKLGKFFDKIISCKIHIETHHHQKKGNIYEVSIDLAVPSTELVVNRSSNENHDHEDVYVALRDAFDAMKRRLQDYVAIHHKN